MADDEGISFEDAAKGLPKTATSAATPTTAPEADEGISFDDANATLADREGMLNKLAKLPHRILMKIGNFVDQATNTENWIKAGKNTADVVGDLPAAMSATPGDPFAATLFGGFPSEFRQGVVKEAVHLPSQLIADLPKAAGNAIADLLLGEGESAKAEAAMRRSEQTVGLPILPSPLDLFSSQTLDRALDVLGFSGVVSGRPEIELTGPEQLQRRAGEFAAAAPIAGARAVLPSIGAAVPTRVAEETAPDDPVWQMLTAGGGAILPELIARKVGEAAPGIAARLPATTREGRVDATGKQLAKATGGRNVVPEAVPVPGLKPTLAQSTDDPALLGLEARAAAEDPKLAAEMVERQKTNAAVLEQHAARAQTAAQTGLEDVSGQGLPVEAKDFATAQLAVEKAAHEAELLKVKGTSRPADVNDAAAARIEQRLAETTKQERGLWERLKALGNQAIVKTAPLKAEIASWMSSLTDIRRAHIPEKFTNFLKSIDSMGNSVNIFELQDLRSLLRTARQDAASGATPDRALAHYYGELEKRVGGYLDSFKFEDKAVQQAYQEARSFTKQRAGIFSIPREMRKVLGSDSAGADLVSSGVTLDTFIKPGAAGRDSIRQLLAADATSEMRELVVQRLAHDIPDNVKAAKKWLADHEPLLTELDGASMAGTSPSFNRFRTVVDRLAAVEKLQKSPLGMLLDTDPEKVAAKIAASKDPAAAAQQLRQQFSGDADAWRGMQRAYADRMMKAISSPDGTIDLNKLAKFNRDNAKINSVFFDASGARTLNEIEQALAKATSQGEKGAAMVGRAGAKAAGAADQRLLDLVIDAAGGGVGTLLAGTAGFVPGVVAGVGATYLRNILRTNAQEVLREAILDPSLGAALLRKANRATVAGLSKTQRAWLGDISKAIPGAVVEAQPEPEEGGKRTVPAPLPQTAPMEKVSQNAAPAPQRRTAERNGRVYTIQPTRNGRYIVTVSDAKKEAHA